MHAPLTTTNPPSYLGVEITSHEDAVSRGFGGLTVAFKTDTEDRWLRNVMADMSRGQIPFVLVGSGRSLAVYRRGLRVISNSTGAVGVLK